MGVSAPFKGTVLQWLQENGLGHDVIKSAGRWQLRYSQGLNLVSIAAATSPLAAEASLERTPDGWKVHGNRVDLPDHAPFDDPHAAFRWWLEVAGK